MSDPRISLLGIEEAKATAETAGVPVFMADLSVFRVLLHNPPVAKALNDLLSTLLWGGKLDAHLRELIIMRLGWQTGSNYEWTQHWRVAKGIGMCEADILGTRDWRAHAGFGPAERAVLAATDETLETGTISHETWATCVENIGNNDALIEMVVAIGNWRMFSSLLRSLEIPLEEGVESWPPDGRIPADNT